MGATRTKHKHTTQWELRGRKTNPINNGSYEDQTQPPTQNGSYNGQTQTPHKDQTLTSHTMRASKIQYQPHTQWELQGPNATPTTHYKDQTQTHTHTHT